MRTIISRDTPFDRWQRGDASAVSESAKRGWEVFQRAKCTNCHSGVFFTDWQFHNVGIGMKKDNPDLGRFNVTKNERDKGAFKTPTLRDVARSGPYFHDGSVATLEEAVRLMASGGIDNPWLDRVNLQKQDLSERDLADLVEFLKSLTESARLREPRLPE
jgi:cytochrome c peroxidase